MTVNIEIKTEENYKQYDGVYQFIIKTISTFFGDKNVKSIWSIKKNKQTKKRKN